jgi:hypothetical protein
LLHSLHLCHVSQLGCGLLLPQLRLLVPFSLLNVPLLEYFN